VSLDLITTKEAAVILNVSWQRVQQLATEGKLRAITDRSSAPRRILFRRSDVERRVERGGRTVRADVASRLQVVGMGEGPEFREAHPRHDEVVQMRSAHYPSPGRSHRSAPRCHPRPASRAIA
jgi:excisionase family DNA binding protein